MKKISLLFMTFICIFILTACKDADPLIRVEAMFSPVNDEQYSKIGATKDLIDPKPEDFIFYEFNLYMKHHDSVKDRKIEMYNFGDLIEAMNDIDGFPRYWTGGWSSQDNESEDFAEYHHEFKFYSKGLSEDEIRNAFKKEKITVSWKNSKNEQFEKVYKLYDLLQFSSTK